ncbi:hypothetical protein R3P38DRAFT_2803858 [Favolaschia claudopus]|uniref:Cytochrome b5 heme-binding domain-containing protein n=1 Tax=Favolaschia claudopus TaxID=2862362 RepID=A0AAV9ZRY7_9AGAR
MSLSETQAMPPLPSLQPNINANLDIMNFPLLTLAEVAIPEDGSSTGLVFDVTRARELFGPSGLFKAYGANDITYALAKGSVAEEDARVVGQSGLTRKEKENLERWFTIFINRFEVVGKTDRVNRSIN